MLRGLESAAAVEDQGLASDEFGLDEVEHRGDDFVRLSGATEGSAANVVGLPLGRIAGHADCAGGDGVYADGGSEFLGENTSHYDDARFRERVGEIFAPTEEAANVGEIDDDSAAGLGEMGRGGLSAEEGGFEIGVEGGVPGFFGSFAEFCFEEIGGAIDENVEATKVAEDVIDEILNGRDIGEFGGECGSLRTEGFDFADKAVGFEGGFAIVDCEVGTFARQTEGDGAAEAFGGAGNESYAAVEFFRVGHAEKVAYTRVVFASRDCGDGNAKETFLFEDSVRNDGLHGAKPYEECALVWVLQSTRCGEERNETGRLGDCGASG
jgi:hypothetical protein